MPLQFTDDGPEFPTALVEDLARGEVVFLCGAGVSAPQLPTFQGLVDEVFKRRGWEMEPGETLSYKADRFEEVLGALSRRLAREGDLYDTMNDVLKIPARADYARHRTLLKLARGLDNRPTIVTTNFDTMFERAAGRRYGNPKELSLAGQAITPPGSPDFAGVIHLHGRLEDPTLGLSGTPLVATSSQYGDAYMRSGWASRFLFDLIRCRTVVLVGYSANDAPVRYFLNLLESDRRRFSDLRPVYALAAAQGGAREAAHHAWSALAVQTIAYDKLGKDHPLGDHGALWRDLETLADMIERPRASRRATAERVLSTALSAASDRDKASLAWAIDRRRDLFDILVSTPDDPAWLDHLRSEKLLADDQVGPVVASWCAQRWTQPRALRAAVTWSQTIGAPFGAALTQALRHGRNDAPAEAWRTAWRLIIAAANAPRDAEQRAYEIKAWFDIGAPLDADVRAAVDLFSPHLSVERPWRGESATDDAPARPLDLVGSRMEVDDASSLIDLEPVLLVPALVRRVAALATEALRSCLATARDAGLITAAWDGPDYGVPSIEAHDQNDGHDGFVPLVQLLRGAFEQIADLDPPWAQRLVQSWTDLGSRIGIRLRLHAFRRPDLFEGETAMSAVLRLEGEAFWEILREWVVLARERGAEARPATLDAIVARIQAEVSGLYVDLAPLEPERIDWRPFARDQAAWLRLSALDEAGVLSAQGQAMLADIKVRQPHLDRPIDERDLFSSYSSGVRSVVGDPETLLAAEPDDRLEVAHQLIASLDIDARYSWSAYAAKDPEGALRTLMSAPVNTDPAMWAELLNVIVRPEEDAELKTLRLTLATQALEHLEGFDDAFIAEILHAIVDVFNQVAAAGAIGEGWWDRLWSVAEQQAQGPAQEDSERFYGRVINSSAGRLVDHLLRTIDQRRKAGRRLQPGAHSRLTRVARSETWAGHLGRGALVASLGFVLSVSPRQMRHLKEWLNRQDSAGAALRAVMVERASLTPRWAESLRAELVQGVTESHATHFAAANVAGKLFWPLLNGLREAPDADHQPVMAQIRKTLAQSNESLREGALIFLRNRLSATGSSSPETWETVIGPVFRATWPSDLRHRDAATTQQLARLSIEAGRAFPQALEAVSPYLMVSDRQWLSLSFLKSEVIAAHPGSVLDLLWSLLGPPSITAVQQLGDVLEKIVQAEPNLVGDRRLQWLEDRAFRW